MAFINSIEKFLTRLLPIYLGMILIVAMPSISFGESPEQNITQSEKIAGLSSVWMEVRRSFPFRERLITLDADYVQSISAVSSTPDLKSYYRELQKFLASLHDGHTFISLPKGMYMTKSRPSLGVTRVGNDAVVTWIRSDLLSYIPLGSIVQTVDGHTYAEAASLADVTVFASSKQVRLDTDFILAMEGEKESVANLTITTPDDVVRNVQVIRGQRWPEGATIVDLVPDSNVAVTLKWIDKNNIAYLAINNFSSELIYQSFLENLNSLKAAKYLVLDLRRNNGGNDSIAYKILSHFLKVPVKGNSSRRYVYDPEYRLEQIQSSEQVAPENLGMRQINIQPDIIQPSTKSSRLKCKLIILTGHDTVSAAEDFIVAASSIKHIRIGEFTAGSTGQPIIVPLPGGGSAHIVSKHDAYPSGEEFVGIGIAPNFEVLPTVEDIRSGRDVVIQKTVELIKTGKI